MIGTKLAQTALGFLTPEEQLKDSPTLSTLTVHVKVAFCMCAGSERIERVAFRPLDNIDVGVWHAVTRQRHRRHRVASADDAHVMK